MLHELPVTHPCLTSCQTRPFWGMCCMMSGWRTKQPVGCCTRSAAENVPSLRRVCTPLIVSGRGRSTLVSSCRTVSEGRQFWLVLMLLGNGVKCPAKVLIGGPVKTHTSCHLDWQRQQQHHMLTTAVPDHIYAVLAVQSTYTLKTGSDLHCSHVCSAEHFP